MLRKLSGILCSAVWSYGILQYIGRSGENHICTKYETRQRSTSLGRRIHLGEKPIPVFGCGPAAFANGRIAGFAKTGVERFGFILFHGVARRKNDLRRRCSPGGCGYFALVQCEVRSGAVPRQKRLLSGQVPHEGSYAIEIASPRQ